MTINDQLVQALFKAGGKPLPLFPVGEASIERAGDLEIRAPQSPLETWLN